MTWSLIHTDGTVVTTGTLESVERYAQETIPRCRVEEREDRDDYLVFDEDGELEARIEEVDEVRETPTVASDCADVGPVMELPYMRAPRVPVECRGWS